MKGNKIMGLIAECDEAIRERDEAVELLRDVVAMMQRGCYDVSGPALPKKIEPIKCHEVTR